MIDEHQKYYHNYIGTVLYIINHRGNHWYEGQANW